MLVGELAWGPTVNPKGQSVGPNVGATMDTFEKSENGVDTSDGGGRDRLGGGGCASVGISHVNSFNPTPGTVKSVTWFFFFFFT
ncbi:hypothetical protein QJS04_geneDACA018635 [Acorus gramineus]|uniref:Uncharacterized protein n=1 Tax=Acorus gramineus TaxID=55184 RepID=A0AAV9AF28_ACOGR|nr:hypothetical protein QJS04_geneDACA018635 [Acorus gramineus]